MATASVKQLSPPVQLGTSPSTIITCPSNPTTSTIVNGQIRLANTTAGGLTATVYAVPASGSPSAANAILSGFTIAANGTLDLLFPQLGPGDTLQALASATPGITLSILDGILFQ